MVTKGSGGNVHVAQENLAKANVLTCSAFIRLSPAAAYASASVSTSASSENKFLPNVKVLRDLPEEIDIWFHTPSPPLRF